MKKFLMLMVMVFVGYEAVAGVCGSNEIVLSGINQYPKDNEFLFDSKEAFDSAPKTNGKHTISGKVWECDNESCTGGKKITLVAGHVFKGAVVNETKTYECYTNGIYDSHWVEVRETHMCGETHVSYDAQKPEDDEFLYSSQTAYDSAKGRGDGATIAGGLVYECDNEHCQENKILPMAAGHVFKGNVIEEARKYRCVHSVFDDKWEVVYEGCQYNGKNINIDSWYEDNNGKRIDLDYAQCSQFQDMNPADAEKKFNAKCEQVGDELKMRCYQIGSADKEVKPECPAGSSDKILSQDNCEKNETFECKRKSDGKCVCGKCSPGGAEKVDPLKKCLDSRTTREGKACCYLPKSVATWNGKECTCIPADKMEFEIGADGKGSCRAKELKTGEKFQCDTKILAQLEAWENECKDQEQIVEWIKRLKELCKSDEVTVQKFNEYYSMLLALGPGNCTWDNKIEVDVDVKLPGGNGGDRNAELSNSRRKISDAHTVLRGMADTFKVSVWKDEEGKFNTARLASDSIAAVVLGTTGALVTSNIVKKNQVENGFEDIKCTIGGQTVADWGDQFRVGIQ